MRLERAPQEGPLPVESRRIEAEQLGLRLDGLTLFGCLSLPRALGERSLTLHDAQMVTRDGRNLIRCTGRYSAKSARPHPLKCNLELEGDLYFELNPAQEYRVVRCEWSGAAGEKQGRSKLTWYEEFQGPRALL